MKRNSISISVFGFQLKEKHPIYVLKECCKDKHVALLLIGEKDKRHYVLIEDFDTFMYDHILRRGRKHFCCYCLQGFSTEEILKHHIKDCLKINDKQRITMPKKDNYFKCKNYERKINSSFMIYTNFERILVPENNGKQTPKESYTNKYRKHIVCSYGYKLVCIDDRFSTSFQTYLGKDAVYIQFY